jgi:hypothetical protein
MTAENVASAFANLAEGTNLLNPVSGMVFNTSGSLITGWTSSAVSQTQYFSSSNHTPYHAVVTFTSALPNTDVNDLTAHVNLLDNDVFIWNGGDAGPVEAIDVIKDFVAWNGTQGDTLNIANLLMGYTHGQSNLSAWVSVVTGQASPNGTLNSTQISIDVDGAGSGTVVQTIWLEGVALNTTDVSVLQFHGVLIA